MDELALGRVVVVRALKGLGDFLCVVPAFRALRAAAPHARVTLLGLESSQPLVERFSDYIDELLPFPGFPGIPEAPLDVRRLPAFFAEVQARSYDLALQMHGNGTLTNPFTILLNATATAGFYAAGGYCPDPIRFLPLDESEHEVQRWLRLLAHLGIPDRGEHLEFPLRSTDWTELRSVVEAEGLEKSKYVAIHPGASELARRWPPEYFAAVADHFARDGYRVVLTGASDEAEVAGAVAARMRYGAVNLAGRTGLGALAALLSLASLLVSNDTGVSHLAAALRVPSVIVFIASDPRRWAPLNRDLHRVVGGNGLLPEDVGPDVVLHEARLMLKQRAEVRMAAATPREEAVRA